MDPVLCTLPLHSALYILYFDAVHTYSTYLAMERSNTPRNCCSDVWYMMFTRDISTIKKYSTEPREATGRNSSRASLIFFSVSEATISFSWTSWAVFFVVLSTVMSDSSSTSDPGVRKGMFENAMSERGERSRKQRGRDEGGKKVEDGMMEEGMMEEGTMEEGTMEEGTMEDSATPFHGVAYEVTETIHLTDLWWSSVCEEGCLPAPSSSSYLLTRPPSVSPSLPPAPASLSG